MREGLREALDRHLARARAEGRTHLYEPEGLELAEHLGIHVPRWFLVRTPEEAGALDLSSIPGDTVVLKVVSADIQHKSDVGGVRFVPRDAAAVEDGVRDLAERLGDRRVDGYMVSEFVPHDPSLGGQLLLGMRLTDDFGPVVTFGPGGVHAEFLARNLRPGRDSAILSPLLASSEDIEAALEMSAITPAATGRLRGQASRMTMEDLRGLLARFLEFANETMPGELREFEINPLVWSANGPVALDALVTLATPVPEGALPRPMEHVRRLLEPQRIAIVGVSRSMNPGHVILKNVLRHGFRPEDVVVVKPGLDEIEGCRCVPDVASIPGRVDLFVVCTPAPEVPALVEAAVEGRKTESLILIAGGLGERRGSEVYAERVLDALRSARGTDWQGPVMNGGNCLGVRSLPGRYDTMFIPEHKLRYPEIPPTPVAMISQSGAFAVTRASKLSTINPRYVVTLGNQMDLTVGDYLHVLAEDPEIAVYACYVEGFRPGDGRRWLEAASRITAGGRPVILYRAGRTAAGAEATASHTASIAGDYAVTRALAEAAGAIVAETLAEFDDLVRLFCHLRDKKLSGTGLGALSNAGFECVAMADNLGPFTLPAFTARTRERLGDLIEHRHLQTIVGVQNLLDLTPIVDDEAYEEAVRCVLGDDNVDVGVIGCVPLTGALDTVVAGEGHDEDLTHPSSIVMRMARLHAASEKPWVAVVDAGPLYDSMARLLAVHGVPTFRGADRAMQVLGRFCRWRLAHGP
jgi:acyl-CoA synthetase (NDP forming)